MNAKGGILGRQVELLVEDSANDVGTGVQKARKLIERDQVDFIIGDVNSGIAQAIAQVTNEKKVLHIVSGGHTDPITGADCKWNMFRVCNTTRMEANAVSDLLFNKYGKKWHFITPDYAFGHTLQKACADNSQEARRHGDGRRADPLGTTDFSAYLIKARAAKPDVLICWCRLGHDQLPQADRAVRHQQADPCRRHAAGARIARRVPPEAQHRHLDVRMVLEAAGRAGRREVRRRHPQGERRQGADGAPLVRLYLG